MRTQRSQSSSTSRVSHSGSGHSGSGHSGSGHFSSHSKSKPRLVGRYELGCTLGQGSFAKVKLARDVKTLQQVAIKVMEKEKILQRNMADQVHSPVQEPEILEFPRFATAGTLRHRLQARLETLSGELFLISMLRAPEWVGADKARDRGDEDGAPPARRAPHRGAPPPRCFPPIPLRCLILIKFGTRVPILMFIHLCNPPSPSLYRPPSNATLILSFSSPIVIVSSSHVSHPCVQVMASQSKIYMVLELAAGGQLFDRIVSRARCAERRMVT
ncbi:unnamed protein product [Closterium sp. Yama58-4]|nr:unnamed protein product [Closterium sp. Yama58-4]